MAVFLDTNGNTTHRGIIGEYNQVDYDAPLSEFSITQNSNGTVTVFHPTLGTDTLTNIDGLWSDADQSWYSIADAIARTGEVVTGTTGNDTLNGSGRNDVLFGGNGNDTLSGGNANDILHGNVGDDRLFGNNGNDTLNGGEGDDNLNGNVGNDTLNGGNGNDTLYGDSGADRLFGNNGNDVLSGGIGNDNLNGNVGNDTLFGGEGNDVLNGGRNDDALNGGNGNDTLHGGTGNDRLFGNNGNDTLIGGTGNDNLNGNVGNDTLFGGNGNDVLFGGSNDDALNGGNGNDVLNGENGDDRLNGNNGNDILRGGEGNDTLNGNVGDDTVDGGNGNDTVSGGKGNDFVNGNVGNDIVNGNNGNDVVWGGTGNDVLNGGNGFDTLHGGTGDDVLNGGAGNDTLTGAGGSDTFVINAGDGHDRITDFQVNNDRIDLSDLDVSFDDLNITTTSQGEVRITISDTQSIFLGNVSNPNALDANDFIGLTPSTQPAPAPTPIPVPAPAPAPTPAPTPQAPDTGTTIDGVITGSNDVNDFLNGDAGANTFFAGRGTDVITGGAGNDTLNVDGDIIEWTFSANADGSVTMTHPTWGENTLIGIENIFSQRGGESFTIDEAIALTDGLPRFRLDEDNVINGTNGDDNIQATADVQGFYGGTGDDVFIGTGDNFEQVNYDGVRSEYNITQNGNGSITVDHPIWGTDTLNDIDGLIFTGVEPGVGGEVSGPFEFVSTDDLFA